MAHRLYIDIETRSAVDLGQKGVYVYAEDPSTSILILSYAVDDGPLATWFILRGDPIPQDLLDAILDPETVFIAHNASFERVLLSVVGAHFLPLAALTELRKTDRWNCTAARAAAFGLPRALERVASALRLEIQKDDVGKKLMLSMCAPQRLSIDMKYIWKEDEESLIRLAEYCEVDVAVERLVDKELPNLSLIEQRTWALTERMNDRGIAVDISLLNKLMFLTAEAERNINTKLYSLTNGAVKRVTNTGDIKAWLVEQGFEEAKESLSKDLVEGWIDDGSLPDLIREVLTCRKEGGKSSTAKFKKIMGRLNLDGVIRGSLLYCGAASTGRYSSRGAQLQNLPKITTVKNPHLAIQDVLDDKSLNQISLHAPPMIVASELLRPMFVAKPGHWLARGDYSAIEARVIAFLAGQQNILDAFSAYDRGEGPDIYRVTYANTFGVPLNEVNKDQRQIGKVCALAMGYSGGKGAFQKMAKMYGVSISDEEAEIVKIKWREANPKIVAFWSALDNSAMECMNSSPGRIVEIENGISFRRNNRALAMKLPSGRSLIYWYPRLEEIMTPWGELRDGITFVGEDTQKKIWTRHILSRVLTSENSTQAFARDIMTYALLNLEEAGLDPRLTVHDEAVCHLPKSLFPTPEEAAEAVRSIMVIKPNWAEGLPIAADASADVRYLKPE